MTIQKMKQTTFQDVQFEQWKEGAIQSLKGKPFESLITETIEGIQLHPLYTKIDYERRIHTIRPMKKDAGWIVAQQTFARDANEFVSELKKSIERGNEAIVYDGTKQLEWDEKSLHEVAELLKIYPIYIRNTNATDSFLNVFNFITPTERFKVQGTVGVAGWSMPSDYLNVRTNGADMWDVHHEGADAGTELALALAQISKHAENASNFDEFLTTLYVHFAVDTHFFMEIAKFRAFRILWHAFCSAFGATETQYIPVLATISLRSYSKLDPYVNLLRAGNATFSAVLGGADCITVHPHNLLTGPTSSSIRQAQNVQLVIKEETHVEKINDPAGGSYFIETLTNELVETAWKLFLEIEKQGGYEVFIDSNHLSRLLEQRKKAMATGETSLIGTNIFSELTTTDFHDWDGIETHKRLAEPFESVRVLFSTQQFNTVLLTFGELKDFKRRADFVSGYLATGGLHTAWSPAFTTSEQAVDWLRDEKPDYVIVCATPAMTETVMEQLLKEVPEGILLDVAGKYDVTLAEKWMDSGLNGFVFSGQNKVEKLLAVHQKLKGRVKNEKA